MERSLNLTAPPEHLEPINTGYKRQILELFRESYPEILTKQEISTRTSIDEGTVDNIVKALAKNGYIERREKKRFPGKTGKHRGGKPPWTYSFENLNFTLNEEKGFQYQFAPGSFQYNKEFLDMYRNIVDKTDQDNIHRLLLKFLKDVFTNVSMSKEDKVRKMKPEFKKDFICSACGLNHEVRDFIRAMLLHLVDQLEITDQFVEFLRNKQFVNEEAYDKLKSIRISTKGQLITDKKKGVVALRILSINKSVGKESSPFLALNRKSEFVYGHIDNMLVSDDFNNNNLIECIPTILDVGIHSSFIHLYQGDYIRKIEDDPSFPSPKYSKIEEIKHSPPPQNRQEANIFYIVERFIVYQPTITERFLHGQKFSAIDTIIGDGTGGDIRLVGHYNEEIELHQGDRIKVFGAWAEHEVEYIYMMGIMM